MKYLKASKAPIFISPAALPLLAPLDEDFARAPVTVFSGLRGPETARERWAYAGLLTLAGLNTDGASSRNGVGFNKSDTDNGANEKAATMLSIGMTDKDWHYFSVRCLPKYWRQIGEPPAGGGLTVIDGGNSTKVKAGPVNLPSSPLTGISAELAAQKWVVINPVSKVRKRDWML